MKVLDLDKSEFKLLSVDTKGYERLYPGDTYRKSFLVGDTMCIGCSLDSLIMVKMDRGGNKVFLKQVLDYKHNIKGKALPESRIENFVVFEGGI